MQQQLVVERYGMPYVSKRRETTILNVKQELLRREAARDGDDCGTLVVMDASIITQATRRRSASS
jgi:hypothetical protein